MSEYRKLKQDELIINPKAKDNNKISEQKETFIKAKENLNNRLELSNEYTCQVKLDSCGKLSAPKTLHFKDYTLEDLLDLNNHINDENYLETLIRVLNNLVFEDFDCSELTEEELKEVLFYIYRKFHSNFLYNVPYYIDENIKDKSKFESKENVGYADIDLGKINTNVISDEFQEPIRLKHEDKIYYFTIARIKNGLYAKNYVDEKYYHLEKKFSNLKAVLHENQNIENPTSRFNIDEKELKEFSKLMEDKTKDIIMITTAMNIYGKEDSNGNIIKFSDEQKIEEYNKVPRKLWSILIKVKEKYCTFGVDDNVEFFSKELEKSIVRRLPFQSVDFIPSLQSDDVEEYDVQFGLSSKNE